nr:metalloregulator ArsR/SmtB family transcription factor [Paenibacillus pinihumi]
MDNLDNMAETFKLLGDRTRLAILGLLREKELCVCNIVDILQISQPSVSQHLRKMKAGGLVHERRQGKWTYYSLNVEDKPYIRQIVMEIPSQAWKLEALNGQPLSSVSCD